MVGYELHFGYKVRAFSAGLDEFLSYTLSPPRFDRELKRQIQNDRRELIGEFCRGCGYCMPCPVGIEINNCARMIRLIRRSPSAGWLTEANRKKMLLIEACRECGQCAKKCPYKFDTPSLLKKNLEDYKNILSGKTNV